MLTRRAALLGSVPFALAPTLARAEGEDQQIALDNPGEYIQADSLQEAKGHHDIETPKYAGPQLFYPFLTSDGVREGWALVEMDVLRDGSVRNPKIADSYPEGVFDRPVLKDAANFRFTPAQIDGQPRETSHHRFRVVFVARGEERGASSENFNDFKRAIHALREKRLDDAIAEMEQLRKARDAGKFNLTELARFSELSARVAVMKRNYVEANEMISTTLWLGQFLESDASLLSAYKLRLMLHIALGKYDQAVDFFDAYSKKYTETDASVVKGIADLRAAGFGKGVKYDVFRLSELRNPGKGTERTGKI